MAVAIQIPDAQTLNMLMGLLVKDKPANMGSGTEKVYGVTQDGQGSLRIPFALGKMLWNLPSPTYDQLPRRQISCTIQLGPPGKEYQVQTYQALVQSLLAGRVSFLSLFCGGGKTMIAIKLFSELGIKTAVVTDATLIFPQWVKVLKETTNARVCEIKSPIEVLPDADIYVMMIGAAGRMHPTVLEPIKFLIVDESTYFMTPTRIPALLNFTPCYSLGLCAEVKRTDGMHAFLPYFFGGQVIRRISDKPFTVYRVETPYKPVVQYQRYNGKVDWNSVLESIADNEQRNNDIIQLCRELTDCKIIIGTKRKEQARYIHAKLLELGESTALLVENAKSFPQCRILVGIYAKMGKGVDVKNLCPDWEGDVFDVAMLVADVTNPEQFVGRVFRHENPIVYHFVDDYSTFRKHFDKDCKPWYLSRKGIIHNMALKK